MIVNNTNNNNNSSNEHNNNNADEEETDTLGSQVLSYISKQLKQQQQNDTTHIVVRPANLATHLGISIDAAERELCGLLSATQCGSFEFENSNGNNSVSMVFQLPRDIVFRAQSVRRREGCWYVLHHSVLVPLVTTLRVLAGIGILLSITIVAIAAILVLLAALVAVMTGNRANSNNGAHHSRSMRMTLFRLREFLWLYAMFGGNNVNPFFRDAAWSTSLLCGSLSSPFSPMFWVRMWMLSNRRRRGRYGRSWAGSSVGTAAADHRRHSSLSDSSRNNALVIREGVWGRDDDDDGDGDATTGDEL
mmetsp:Transcript_18968/g.29308  ORF Transcript_18968/g.29308 Transcript_18968/m.29308 type:complete len:305 (-) Transcript_18968:42-956(-)